MIEFVAKDKLYPAFGRAWPASQTAWVRADLPDAARRFVAAHESYHLQDAAKWWVWRELKANFHAGIRHPWGFIVTAVMSLAPERVKFYYMRWRCSK